MTQEKKLGLLERLARGPVICAEGYLFEMERRGYVQAGAFVPEVVLDHPEKVEQLHREFVHAGSDVVEAFTYYAHREKLRIIDKEHLLEKMNKGAIAIAKTVAGETGALVAGDICNTNIFDPDSADSKAAVQKMFDEQVAWAAEAGVDFIIAETFSYAEEAIMAAKAIKKAGLTAVVTMAMHQENVTRDKLTPAEACKRIADAGADVVGLNCCRGMKTMLPFLGSIREAVKVPVAALPVPYRTTEEQPTFQSLRDPLAGELAPGGMPFPTALDPFTCTRYEVAEFTKAAANLGVNYFGLCCGGAPHHIRSMAEALGKKPEASRYTADMSKHAYFGTNAKLKDDNREYSKKL
jgi:betaine-homocysteine S-methyltransferase